MGYREIQEYQGWTDETLLELALQFIEERRAFTEFENYLENLAVEENQELEFEY